MRIALEPTLAFTNQVNCISRVCLYHLCQLHSICRSLSLLAISILVHAMICTQVDLRMLFIFPFLPPTLIYFNLFSMLLPIAWAAFTNLLIFQALSGTDFIGSLFNSVYSSNPLLLMCNCLVRVAPTYLRSFCTLVSSLPGRASLQSSTRGLMVIPRMRAATARSRLMLAPWLGTVIHSPCAWYHLSCCGNALRLSLLT